MIVRDGGIINCKKRFCEAHFKPPGAQYSTICKNQRRNLPHGRSLYMVLKLIKISLKSL